MTLPLVVCSLLLAPAVLAAAYHLLLAAWTLCRRQPAVTEPTGSPLRFAILIPAHNEERHLGATLASCTNLDYPRDAVQIFVVADNCTDSTADIARGGGAICLERHDTRLRGKGQALAWALTHVLPTQPDAVIILDADCTLDRHALRSFQYHLERGHDVLQANYLTGNPDESPTSLLTAVGNVLENDFFYRPKSDLGLAVLLRGTGMVFRTSVLRDHPWNADSLTEDVEYALHLLRQGVQIHYLPEVNVLTPFPTDLAQLRVQRERWGRGNARLLWARAFPLMAESLRRGNLRLFDAGWTLLVLSRPLLLLYVLLVNVVLGVAALATGSPALGTMSLMAAAVFGFFVLYVAAGLVRLGMTKQRLAGLRRAVGASATLMLVTLRSLLPTRRPLEWTRTPRT